MSFAGSWNVMYWYLVPVPYKPVVALPKALKFIVSLLVFCIQTDCAVEVPPMFLLKNKDVSDCCECVMKFVNQTPNGCVTVISPAVFFVNVHPLALINELPSGSWAATNGEAINDPALYSNFIT